MKKFNKLIYSLIVVFVALLFTNISIVLADEVTGDGTKGNPYVIEAMKYSAKKVTFEYETIPFYFVVAEGSEGSYSVSYEAVEKKVTFMLLESTNDEISVMLDDEKYKDTNNWQVGVDTMLNQGIGVSIPTYDIFEELEYYSDVSKFISYEQAPGSMPDTTPRPSYTSPDQMFGQTINYNTGKSNLISILKTTKLYNVVVRNAAATSKSNLYFFETSKGASEAKNLLTAMDYQYTGTDGEFGVYKLTGKSNVETKPDIYMANSHEGEDGNAIRIVYKFGGFANTALNDDGEEKNGLEALITRILISLGDNLLLGMMRKVLGSDLTIDALIFNKFEPTKINLYNKNATGVNFALRETINYWFKVLLVFVYIVYIIILVYIGIMIVITAGTARQNKMKSALGNWVVGLAILYFLPTYGIPILFDLNDALVKYISKNSSSMETYYNEYDIELTNDILGSDSATISIEELVALRARAQEDYDKFSSIAAYNLKGIKQTIKTTAIVNSGGYASYTAADIAKLESKINDYLDTLYDKYKYFIDDLGYSSEGAKYELEVSMKRSTNPYSGMEEYLSKAFRKVLFTDGKWDELFGRFEEVYNEHHTLEEIDRLINAKQTDIMGTMRAYAGKYQKLIFAFIWYMLLFQLIGLTFLYFKRLFVIAILIAVFPLIMLFYCIDKLADGKSQTFSLWMKELLSNIFIQSIHAIVYTVLVEMGLTIYRNDPSNWMFLVGAMLMILPAEGIMKEVFGLNGSTLRAVQGSLMNAAIAIGTAKTLLTAGRRKNDASMQEKNNKRFDKLQRRQNRADTRAKTREAKRAGNTKNYDANGNYKPKLSKGEKFREGLYHVGTEARQLRANVAPHLDNAARIARNVGATAAGTMYGLSNGGVEGMAQGAQVAQALSGKTKTLSSKDIKIKTELKSAYQRKKK